jgi:hypothetical protein
MKYKPTLLAGIFGCTAALAVAQETESPSSPSPGEQNVTQKIAGQFADFAGDDAQPLVDALRNGTDLSYDVETQVEVEVPEVDADGNPVYQTNPDGTQVLDADGNPVQQTTIEMQTVIETVVVTNTAGPMGFGNVKISMTLAEKLLAQQGLDADMASISGALFGIDPATADGILELRAAGEGWGQISKELLNTNLGSLMSAKNSGHETGKSSEHAQGANKTAAAKTRPVSTGRPDHASSSAKPSKPDRPSRPAKADRPEKPERPEKPDRPEKPERPEKPDRPEKPERPEKPAKPDRPNR